MLFLLRHLRVTRNIRHIFELTLALRSCAIDSQPYIHDMLPYNVLAVSTLRHYFAVSICVAILRRRSHVAVTVLWWRGCALHPKHHL